MNFSNTTGFNLVFTGDHFKPALLISLLSVWLLVAVFYYLNTYTKRRYFTIWTAAWLFYALWLTLFFGGLPVGGEPKWLAWLKQWCISVSALFLLWGSLRFLGERVKQRLIGFCLVFLLALELCGLLLGGDDRAELNGRCLVLRAVEPAGLLFVFSLSPAAAFFGRGAADDRLFSVGSLPGIVSAF